MRIVIVDTYYPKFVKSLYSHDPGLRSAPYREQLSALLSARFGTSDFYSRHLTELGQEASDIVANAAPAQKTWARDNRVAHSSLAIGISHRFFRLPLIGPWLSTLPGLAEIAIAQLEEIKPDVLYCQDLSFFPPSAIARLRNSVRLVVGQNASPLPPDAFVKSFDLILTSFPHVVPRLRERGTSAEYFRIGFDAGILDQLGPVQKEVGASFVGGISRHHGQAVPTLEYLADNTPIEFFGYGANKLPLRSPIRRRHHGEVWGLDMYRALARSKVTLNRHINVAENNANNMRLYEATGVGTMLITDMKDNLHELFEIGKEVVAYSSPQEAAELIRYYLAHEEEAQAIARAGQARTLREHTYEARMRELVPILERYLG
jgi:hypothetical protein